MKKNTIFSTVGEFGMLALLVVLFIAPFAVATILTPGYDTTPTKTAKLDDGFARANSDDSRLVLGADATEGSPQSEKIKDIRMRAVNSSDIAVVDSYVTSDHDGRFLYRIVSIGEGTVFQLVNEGNVITDARLRVDADFDGWLWSGNKKLGKQYMTVRLPPNSETDVVLSADSLGKFSLWVEID